MKSTCNKTLSVALCLLAGTTGWADERVQFNRDIQPVLAEHCALCHGVDAAVRKSGLRLDLRDSALKGGESGTAAIVPGQPEQSELIRRITSTDADVVMPPPRHKKALSAKQIDVLTRWIKEGANYESHWSFITPLKAKLPDVGVAHPVDAIVVSQLKGRSLSLSPAATSAALCRRMYLDLIGLPPSPDELAAFEQRGFEATVETHGQRA